MLLLNLNEASITAIHDIYILTESEEQHIIEARHWRVCLGLATGGYQPNPAVKCMAKRIHHQVLGVVTIIDPTTHI